MAETKKLNSIFLTAPGGLIYEIPEHLAKTHILTPERMVELGGHLPITPYVSDPGEAGVATAASEEPSGDVRGHHRVIGDRWPTGGRYHREPQYGTYRGSDGVTYCGYHYHPFGDEGASES